MLFSILLISLIWVSPAWAAEFVTGDAEGSCTDATNTSCPPFTQLSGGGDLDGSTTQAHGGTKSYRFHLPAVTGGVCSGGNIENCCNLSGFRDCGQEDNQELAVVKPQKQQAYYSYWVYPTAGLNSAGGVNFEMKADNSSAGTGTGPKIHLGIQNKGSGRRWYLSVRGCGITGSTGVVVGSWLTGDCNYQNSAATVALNAWHHIEMFLKSTTSNGEIKVWQNGTLIYHVSHANFNTLTCPSSDDTCGSQNFERAFLHWGVGLYQFHPGAMAESHTLFIDDLKVTDTQVGASGGGADTTAPGTPLNVVLSTPFPGHMLIDWDIPNTGETGDLEGYKVKWCEGVGCTPTTEISPSGTATSYLHTGLTPGSSYSVQVQAYDDEVTPNTSSYTTTKTLEVAPTQLRAHWDMEDGTATTATDVVNGHNGTLVGGVNWIVGQVGDFATNFPGTQDWIEVAHHDDLNFLANQDFTFGMWVKSSQAAALDVWPQLYNKADGVGPGIEVGLHYSNTQTGKWYATFWKDNDEFFDFFGCSDVADGTWHHIAIRRQGTTLTAFEDGVACPDPVTNANVAVTIANLLPVYMGIFNDEVIGDYTGDMDDVQIYAGALSDAQIAAMADIGGGAGVFDQETWRCREIDEPEDGSFQSRAETRCRIVQGNQVRVRTAISRTVDISPPTSFIFKCRSPFGTGATFDWFTLDDDAVNNPLFLGSDNQINVTAPTTGPQLTVPGKTYINGGKVYEATSNYSDQISIGVDQYIEREHAIKARADQVKNTTFGCAEFLSDGTNLASTEIQLRVVSSSGQTN